MQCTNNFSKFNKIKTYVTILSIHTDKTIGNVLFTTQLNCVCIGVNHSPDLDIAYELKQTFELVHQYIDIISSDEAFSFLWPQTIVYNVLHH